MGNQNKKETEDNSSYIQDKLIDVLQSIAKRGTIQEKLLGIVLWIVMDSMTKKINEPNGIDHVLNKLLKIAVDNKTISDGLVNPEDLTLLKMGIQNVMGLLDSYAQGDESSPHIYTELTNELDPESEESDNKKLEYIEAGVRSLNEDIANGNVNIDDAQAELKKIIEEANKRFGGEDSFDLIDVSVDTNNSLKNRMCESLFDLYNTYNIAIMNRYKSNKENRENEDNFYAINVIKALMIVHRLGMTREMAQHMYEHNDFYRIVTAKINEIAKKSNMSIEEFFRVRKLTEEEKDEIEKEITNNSPDIDRSIKDLLNGINFN